MTRQRSSPFSFESSRRHQGIGVLTLALAVLFAAATFVFVPPATADAASEERSTIVLNEFAVASSISSADSFFELRNVTSSPIDLTGWSVFRCDERGLRAKIGRPEVSLEGVILAAGEIFLATQMSARIATDKVDARFSEVYSQSGVGLVLVDPDGTTVDAVAMYPNTPWPTQSECAPTPNLPASLAAALDESWQRSDAGEWVRSTATAGGANAPPPTSTASDAVRIDELAAAGPGGSADDFVELRNTTRRDIDISGWKLYRCTATGAMTPASLQIEFAQARILKGGDRLLIGGPGYAGAAEPDERTTTSLADAVSGVALVTEDGRRVDGVTLSEHADTACQSGDHKLGSAMDHRAAQSWQRTDDGFIVAVRTPGRDNASPTDAAAATEDDSAPSVVQISEFATDPVITPTPSDVDRSNFVELANFSTRAHDIGGWRVYACGHDGFLSREPLAVIPRGTVLRPGATWLAALAGTPAAASADATFASPFHFQGAGVWIEDAGGMLRDAVGAFHVNEMDRSIDTPSACTSGLSLPVFAVDRMRGESYQRTQQTGDNMDDFAAAPATPDLFDQPAPAQLEVRALTVASDVAFETRQTAALSSSPRATATIGTPATILEAFAGRSEAGALDGQVGSGERAVTSIAAEALAARDDGYGFPYVRFSVAVGDAPSTVHWSGTVLGRSQLRFSVWNDGSDSWRELDSGSGNVAGLVDQPAQTALQLSGAIRPEEVSAGTAWLLVQVVPRSGSGLTASEELGEPADYDFAVTHLTDTQYLTEAYPEVYADLVGWVVGSAEHRKIAFATHTGDLIQNWVDPDQPEDRARHEFEIASRMQSVLDDAGVPNSVLPGNHDSKRGITSDLFNEYFGPERYADAAWYGGSIAPGDNTANFSTFTAGGALMLMLSLPYAYGAREISWRRRS